MKQIVYFKELKSLKYTDSYNAYISSNDILSQLFQHFDIPECIYERTWYGLKNALEEQWWFSTNNIVIILEDISRIPDKDMVNYIWLINNLHESQLNFTFIFNEKDIAIIKLLHTFVEIADLLNDIIKAKDYIWKNFCGGDKILFQDICYHHKEYRYIANIKSIKNKTELFEELSTKLHLPSYFGHNWDALNELFNDFHWIDEKEIIIIHEDVSSMNQNDLEIYIKIISNSLISWQQDTKHIIKYIFKTKDKDLVQCIMNK
ncbi:MAG: barstar family protein [Muribaculaceae bacterium]|nr:barstar family protein [Muribaculaceae bacterium]